MHCLEQLLRLTVGIKVTDDEQLQGPDYAEHGIESDTITCDQLRQNFPEIQMLYDKNLKHIPNGFSRVKDDPVHQRRRQVCDNSENSDDRKHEVKSAASGTNSVA